jgi:AraC-like DNA-binding protein/CRP-like cAMP-binding protein
MGNHLDVHSVPEAKPRTEAAQPWPDLQMVEPGTVLFHEGSEALDVYWIVEGVIKLIGRADRSEPPRDVAHGGHGTHGGHIVTRGLRRGVSLLEPFAASHPRAHTATAIAIEPTRLYRFAADDFRERLADQAFMDFVHHAMSLASAADFQDDMRGFLRDPEQRLLSVLSTLVDEQTTTAGCVNLSLPRDLAIADLAGLVQVTPSELTRLLDDWSLRGCARWGHEGITFCWTSLKHYFRPSGTHRAGTHAAARAAAPGEALARAASPTTPPDARVTKVLHLIERSFADDSFGLREVSREVNLSPWYLSRLLKGVTRMTFRQLRNAVRIERARVALLTTDLSIKEISAHVGYTHPSDLTRHFRAAHDVSPNGFRARARGSAGAPNHGGADAMDERQ